jgi:hypothetical protein
MTVMAVVISLDAWRAGRREAAGDAAQDAPGVPRAVARLLELRGADDCARLARAVERLDLLVRPDADRDRLAPDIERDMLTIVGELAMGWFDQAADRAERLCDRLVAQGG